MPNYSSEPHKPNKKDYWLSGMSIFSHSDSGRCCILEATGRLAPNYPASSKATAQVPHTLESHVAENLLSLSTSTNHTRSSLGRTQEAGNKILQYFKSLVSNRNAWGAVCAGTHQGWEVGSGSPIPSRRRQPPSGTQPCEHLPLAPGASRGCPGPSLRPSPPSAEGTRGPRVAAELPGPNCGDGKAQCQGTPAGERAAAPAAQGAWRGKGTSVLMWGTWKTQT